MSPRGDDPGFVRVRDDHMLLVPERTGNRLADTLTNLVQRPAIGMLFLVPGCAEMLRVNGRRGSSTARRACSSRSAPAAGRRSW